jgi:adenylate cyclase
MTRPTAEVLQFDDFELDASNGELRKAGTPVALQPQPFRALAFLAARSGQVTTREEIRRQLWGPETFVDFKCGVNFCIRQIRKALGENARNHLYIETLHRRGYRFTKPVNRVGSKAGIGLSGVAGKALVADREPLRPTALAILPFSDLGCPARGNCLAEGITELLTTRFSANRSLRVVSRTTSMNYKHLAKTLQGIGRELAVDLVFEGGVSYAGGRARITARLIDALTDQSRWGATYEFEMRDYFDLQDRAVRAIVRDSAIHLGSPLQRESVPGFAVTTDAEMFYNRGCYYLNKRTEKSLFKAIECFERAIAALPGNASAYAGLARAYTILGYYGPFLPREMHHKAKAAAQKALRLDARLADAHAVLAYCSMLYGWNWVKAEAGFRNALELDPRSVTAHQWYADFLTTVKRHDEAIEEMRRACELNPLSILMKTDLGWILLQANRDDQAIDQYRQVLEVEPDSWLAHWGLGLAYGQNGLFQEAIDSLEEAIRITEGTPAVLAALGHVLGASGRKNNALRVLSNLHQRARNRYVPAYDMATVTWGLGEVTQTMSWLNRACSERSAYLVNLEVDSRFKKLRSLQPVHGITRLIGLCSP